MRNFIERNIAMFYGKPSPDIDEGWEVSVTTFEKDDDLIPNNRCQSQIVRIINSPQDAEKFGFGNGGLMHALPLRHILAYNYAATEVSALHNLYSTVRSMDFPEKDKAEEYILSTIGLLRPEKDEE